MLMGFFLFASGDVQAKLLTDTFHPLQIVWLRSAGLTLGVIVLLAWRGTHILRAHRPGPQIVRGLAAAGSAFLFVTAVKHVPLASAVAVSFVAPFMLTIAGAVLLREPVGPRRWAAVVVGFVGMLIVIRPGLGVFHPAILLVVAAAGLFAARQVLSRLLSGTDSIETTVAYTALTATGVLSIALPFVWIAPPDARSWALIVGLSLTAALGEILVIRALDMAQAVVLAPLHYSLILWGTIYGFIAFGDLPDHWTIVGCAIIIASGLYTLHRERLRMKGRA
ncbi:DMT family transporter [Aestuariicoccus sp. KMU-90]|uniref:DMT family transporter n=2 Tax=Thetidibacter halocola TaxID=2827239 RepID=A0A8J7WDG4_9RHOB|nr:DMT family transporter [Thetidibacter halocola]